MIWKRGLLKFDIKINTTKTEIMVLEQEVQLTTVNYEVQKLDSI